MKLLTLSVRTSKEILRDPVNIAFGLGFPIVLLLLLSAIQASVPVSLFEIDKLTPGISVFGLSFMTLFSASLVSKDRETSFLQRLYTTPLNAIHYILGYALPIIPIAIAQTTACYLFAAFLGLEFSLNLLVSIIFTVPLAIFFISLGLLFGSVLSVKQVGGLCGALITNLTAWLSGIWFDLSLVGGWFEKIANLLPFVHAVKLQQSIVSGDYVDIFPHIYWIIFYMFAAFVFAVILFIRQMKKC